MKTTMISSKALVNNIFVDLTNLVNDQTDDYKFDCFIEKLQEIVIEDQFEKMQNDFLEKYYKEFEDKNENKLIYTQIFKEYTALTEKYIETNLIKRLPKYNIDDFYKLLEKRKKQIDEQLLDTLLSFTDFQTFKEMMLDYKARKNHKQDLFIGINIEKVTKEKHGENLDNFEELKKNYKKK